MNKILIKLGLNEFKIEPLMGGMYFYEIFPKPSIKEIENAIEMIKTDGFKIHLKNIIL